MQRIRTVPRAYLGLAAAYVFLRILAILGTTAESTFPDSATYRHAAGQPAYPFVSLTGHAMRPFVAPLLYAIVPSDNLRTDAQVLISILAWLTLAATVAYALRDRRVRLIAVVVILALSCTSAVTSWDRAILAESLSISFAVVALAAWIWFVKQPSALNAAAVVASTTIWCFTKSATFPIVGLAAVLVLVSMIRTGDRQLRGGVAAALILVSAWGLVANNRSDKTYERYQGKGLSQFNTNFALELRLEILNSPSDTAWFVAHGMPDPNGLPLGYKRPTPMDDTWFAGDAAFTEAYLARRDLVRWGNDKSQHVYEEFVLTHPSELISRFSRELPYVLVPTRNHLVYTTGPRAVLPSAAESLLFDTTPSVTPGGLFQPAAFGDVGLLGAAAVALAFAARRRARDVRLLIAAGATLLLAFVSIAIVWVLSPIEIARHALPASVLLRVSLWLAVFVMLDAIVADRAAKRAA
jgi:hypothetical protein